jgi:hypothetical protein
MSENPFRVRCCLCDKEDDLRKMRRFEGSYYHSKKTKGFSKSCLDAAKDVRKGR